MHIYIKVKDFPTRGGSRCTVLTVAHVYLLTLYF